MCLCLTCATTSVLCRVRDLLALGMSMLMLTILIARWGKGDVLEAPVYWRDLDPYWQGSHHLMRRYFHLDGSQTADPDDRVWGGHECCFSTVTTIVSDGKIREHYVRINKWPKGCWCRGMKIGAGRCRITSPCTQAYLILRRTVGQGHFKVT